jgi:hypothetical protein
MPKIAVYKSLIFYLLAYDLSERTHLHIFSKNHNRMASAKIWLDNLEVFDSGALSSEEINLAVKLMEKNKEAILKQIERFSNNQKVKTLQLKLK